MRPCSSASSAATSATSPASACLPRPAHRTLNTRAGLTGFAAKTAAASLKNGPRLSCPNLDPQHVKTERIQHPTKSPPEISLRWAVLMSSPSPQHSLLVAATMTAKIEMKSRNTDVAMTTAAVMAGAMTRALPAAMTGTRTATVSHGAPGIDGFTAVVAAHIHALAIHGRPARATGVRVATAGVVMMITSLQSYRSEHGETGSDSQECDELFHIELGLIRCRQMSGLFQETRPQQNYSGGTNLFYEHRRNDTHH